MRKLLFADFARLWKNRIFWLGMVFLCGLGAVAIAGRYQDILEDPNCAYTTADGFWFLGGMYISVVLSVFISLWLGTEYHDGTVRNKLTVGHTRKAIYAANWLTCTISSLMMHIGYILVVAVCGGLLLEPFRMPVFVLVVSVLVSLLAVVAMSSVFVLIAMLVSSRSTGAVISMIAALVMIFGSMIVYSRLSAPEYYDSNFVVNINGEYIQEDPIPNPKYLRGTEREIYQFIQDFQPVGQMMQFNVGDDFPENIVRFPVYSLVLTLLTTGVGYALFRRKDIR